MFSSLHYANQQAGRVWKPRAVCLCLPKGEGFIGIADPYPLHTFYSFAWGKRWRCVSAMPFSLQYLLSFGLQHLQVISRRYFQDFVGGREAPVVSKCFYKNGLLTYLSFYLDQGMEKWKKEIHKPNQWHCPRCVLEDGLQYVCSQALGLTVMR